MNLNRELYEALGYCWHEKHAEYRGEIACTCWATFKSEEEFIQHCKSSNPNYKAEPWLVIGEMEKRKELNKFWMWLHIDKHLDGFEVFNLLAMDRTGKIATIAKDWLRKLKGENINEGNK